MGFERLLVSMVMISGSECHKPRITGDGNHTAYQNGDDWGMLQMALF